jgi:hypothetical protein
MQRGKRFEQKFIDGEQNLFRNNYYYEELLEQLPIGVQLPGNECS